MKTIYSLTVDAISCSCFLKFLPPEDFWNFAPPEDFHPIDEFTSIKLYAIIADIVSFFKKNPSTIFKIRAQKKLLKR